MLYTYTNTNQAVNADAPVLFNTNGVLAGCSTSHTAGTSTITIDKSGYYIVSFNGTGAATATGTDPIEVSLYNNGNPINGAVSSSLSTGPSVDTNVAFSAIIYIRKSCCAINNTANLTVVNTGVAASYSNVALTVHRL